MTKKNLVLLTAVALVCGGLLTAPLQAAENYGGVFGLLSVYQKTSVSSPAGSGNVGPGIGAGGGFVLGQTMGTGRWGGELRYFYSKNDYELDAGAQSHSLGGQSHTVHYDVLYYLTDSNANVRPFIAFGGGFRVYQGTGTEQPDAPGSDLALLTKSNQTLPTGDFGVGVRFRLGNNLFFRVEFRDFITESPDKVITPSLGADIGSILHNWTPMFGITWIF